MSKLLKYTSRYDNNPNSDIGASKTVVKSYKKMLEKERLRPIMQEMNNQTKSVVTNLNDYSLLLKNITQNLVNAELYLSNPEVSNSKGEISNSKGAGRYIGGVLTEKEKKKILDTASKKGIENRAQALKYIQDSYRDKPANTKISEGDKNIIKAFKLANIEATTNASKVLIKIDESNKVVIPEEKDEEEEEEEDLPEEYVFETNSPNPHNIGVNIDQLMEGDRYGTQPKSGNIHGGEPEENESSGEEEENELSDESSVDEDGNESYDEEEENDTSGYSQSEIPSDGDYGDDGDEVTDLNDLIKLRGKTPIRENFIITLFSNIINQVHKASDFWETNVTPNLSDIPKLKMDSFIKSNAVNNFENAITRFEDILTSGIIKTHINYLDNIYHSLTNALDELFSKMNVDIKRYSSGLSSSSDKPKLMGSGYLPFQRSVYSSHLRDSNTKYLM